MYVNEKRITGFHGDYVIRLILIIRPHVQTFFQVTRVFHNFSTIQESQHCQPRSSSAIKS